VYGCAWGTRWRTEVRHRAAGFEEQFLRFQQPFESRDELEASFDELFDGTEAILAADEDAYAACLGSMPRAAERLLGEQYLIPLPHWATGLAAYTRHLRVRIIDGDYDPERGLTAVRPRSGTMVYEPGELI
jgi:CRISPR-associated endonuclease/helicase Cas3